MKKLLIAALVMSFFLTSCGKKKEETNQQDKETSTQEVPESKVDEKPKSIKKDDSLPFAYGVDPITYERPNLDSSDFGNSIFNNNYGIEEPFRNDKIKININSDDALKIENDLASMYEDNIANIRYRDNGDLAEARGLVINEIVETDTFIGISVVTYGYIMNSDGFFFKTCAYQFDKQDGHLLSRDEVYKKLNTSQESVQEKLDTYYSENNLVESEGETS